MSNHNIKSGHTRSINILKFSFALLIILYTLQTALCHPDCRNGKIIFQKGIEKVRDEENGRNSRERKRKILPSGELPDRINHMKR